MHRSIPRYESGVLGKLTRLLIRARAYACRWLLTALEKFGTGRPNIEALNLMRFSYRPGFGCSWCDYREVGCGDWDGG